MDKDPIDARVGQTLSGKWTLDRLLGIGGMAAVYAASHRNGATAAIKILHPEFARRPEARSRFLREAYIANKAGKGAVAVLDDDVADDGSPYLVMELLRGEAVDQRAARLGGKLALEDVLWVAAQALSTLDSAHQAGIIHRDLKPENLFWTTDQRLKVLDFGIARLRDTTAAEATRTGMIMGTPSFMAPEQAIGSMSDIDARSDIFSLGAIMFTLLTGREIHEGGGNAVVTAATRHAPSLATLDSAIPRSVVRVVDRALAFDREARYPSAAAMRDDVEKIIGGRGDEIEPPPPAVQASPRSATGPVPPSSDRTASSSGRRGFATQMSGVDAEALRGLFGLLTKALAAHVEHGPAHPKSIRKLDMAYRRAFAALSEAHIGLFWNVEPEGFVVRHKELIWRPDPPLPPVGQLMFRGGVRMLGLLPGMTKPEFEVITRMLANDLAPFSDFATLLQSSDLKHLVYRIDPLTPQTPAYQSLTLDPASSAVPVAAILGMLTASDDPAVRATLLTRLQRRADGHEAEIGNVLEGAGVELAIGLLRVLALFDTGAARAATALALKSQHPIVRVAALSRLEAVDPRAGERLRAELHAALEGAEVEARLATLAQIERYRVKAAGQALELRVRTSTFDALSVEERRLALGTLGAVAPERAEEIAVELLQDEHLTSPEAHEATRELAAELLGRMGASHGARDALQSTAAGRFRSGAQLRRAAESALAALEARVHLARSSPE